MDVQSAILSQNRLANLARRFCVVDISANCYPEDGDLQRHFHTGSPRVAIR